MVQCLTMPYLTHRVHNLKMLYKYSLRINCHFCDFITITMASWWARWRLKSPTSQLFTQPFNQADKKKHQSSASLAFLRGIHRWPVNLPHKGPVTRKMFPFGDVIMTETVTFHFQKAGVRTIRLTLSRGRPYIAWVENNVTRRATTNRLINDGIWHQIRITRSVIHSFWHNDAIWRHRSGSTLAWVIVLLPGGTRRLSELLTDHGKCPRYQFVKSSLKTTLVNWLPHLSGANEFVVHWIFAHG